MKEYEVTKDMIKDQINLAHSTRMSLEEGLYVDEITNMDVSIDRILTSTAGGSIQLTLELVPNPSNSSSLVHMLYEIRQFMEVLNQNPNLLEGAFLNM